MSSIPTKTQKKRPGPRPVDGGRSAVTPIRSTISWKRSVEAFAAWDLSPSVSDLIDRAVAHYARDRGYAQAIARR